MKRLAASKDLGELRKTAQTIGDRAIAGTLRLSENDQAVVRSVVTGCLKQAQSSSAQERVEAKHQIERLWHAAVPTLLDHFDDENMATAELAVKSLILMRDERIISALVDKAKAATSDRSRQMALFALKKMTEQRKSDIPGRKCLDDETSQKLYQELVSPALAEPIQ